MTAKQNFKILLDNRLVEPFLEYGRSQGVRLGNLIVKRAYQRLEASKSLTLRQQVAARLAEEYISLQKATSPKLQHPSRPITEEELNRPNAIGW